MVLSVRSWGLLVCLCVACGSRGATAGDDGTEAAETATGASGVTSTGTDSSEGGTETGDETDEGADTGDESTGTGGEGEACSTKDQDCAAGLKCTGYTEHTSYDKAHCVPIVGDGQAGSFCTRGNGNDDCAKGLFCLSLPLDEGSQGTCVAYCHLGEPCPVLENAECLGSNASPNLEFCYDPCEPMLQDCADGLGCYYMPASTVWWGCMPVGAGQYGDPCDNVAQCVSGLICVDASVMADCNGEGCCTTWCDLDDPCPTPGDSCRRFPPLEYYYDTMVAPTFGVCAAS